MIRIVTIEREYGSGGGEIAQLLAKQLGWKLWDQDLTEEIAKLANCPKAVVEVREERTDPLLSLIHILSLMSRKSARYSNKLGSISSTPKSSHRSPVK